MSCSLSVCDVSVDVKKLVLTHFSHTFCLGHVDLMISWWILAGENAEIINATVRYVVLVCLFLEYKWKKKTVFCPESLKDKVNTGVLLLLLWLY